MGTKHAPTRPVLKAPRTLNVSIKVRLLPDVKQVLRRLADARGLKISDLVREAITQFLQPRRKA